VNASTGATIVSIDPELFRATEVEHLQGDASKAKKELDWEPETSFQDLIKEMVQYEHGCLQSS
jgi:GDPmannose 4,6-dehydratase